MKICVYAIALNEEKFVKRFCNAAAEADLILVADTGSTDGTIERLLEEKRGHDYHKIDIRHIRVRPWRFDDARNAALTMIPDDIDVCVSADLDEVLQPGWRQEIERVWTSGTTRLRYGFDWGCGIVFKYEKIHARFGYRWHHPCHEYPVPDRIIERWADTDMLLLIHKPDPTKSRGQYLDLLKTSIEEDPNCPRNAFYYARELSYVGRWSESIEQCKRYLALPRADWKNERCYAMRTMVRCYTELREWDNALAWARRACSEAADTREPWIALALTCYHTYRWAECLGAALSALQIVHKELVYTVDPEVWKAQPHDLASLAAWNLGLKDLAAEHARKAIELGPEDLRLRHNLELIVGDKDKAA